MSCWKKLLFWRKKEEEYNPIEQVELYRPIEIDDVFIEMDSNEYNKNRLCSDDYSTINYICPLCGVGIKDYYSVSVNCGHRYCLDCFTKYCHDVIFNTEKPAYKECSICNSKWTIHDKIRITTNNTTMKHYYNIDDSKK